MSDQIGGKDYWEPILRLMLRNFRLKNPNNAMGERELLDSMMMSYNRNGIVGQAAGKWVLPQIDDPDAVINMLEAEYKEIVMVSGMI